MSNGPGVAGLLFGLTLSLFCEACGGDIRGGSVWSSDASALVVEDQGAGNLPDPPAGSSCDGDERRYTFTVSDDRLAWRVCSPGATALAYVEGARTLTATERDHLVAVWQGVVLTSPTGCSPDRSIRTVTITTPDGETTFLDSSCCASAGEYVGGVDTLLSVANDLVR